MTYNLKRRRFNYSFLCMLQSCVMQGITNALSEVYYWLTDPFANSEVKNYCKNRILNDVACELTQVENMNIVV